MPRSLQLGWLNRLPALVQNRLMPVLDLVTLEQGQLLYQAGHVVRAVYFPVTAVIEEVLSLPCGQVQVLRRVDAQSVAGCCVLGDPVAARTARVTQAGQAYCMQYGDFAQALDDTPTFREAVMQDAVRGCLLLPDAP